MRATRLAFGLTLLAALPACDNFPSYERIGISLADDNETIQIHFEVCGSQRVTEVRLEDVSGPDEESPPVVWQINSEEGSDQAVYAVGTTPDGFIDTVPLSADLGADRIRRPSGSRPIAAATAKSAKDSTD